MDSSVASLPLNDVREVKCAAGAAVTWTWRPEVSVIQRAKPVESPTQGHTRQYQPREGLFKVILYEL